MGQRLIIVEVKSCKMYVDIFESMPLWCGKFPLIWTLRCCLFSGVAAFCQSSNKLNGKSPMLYPLLYILNWICGVQIYNSSCGHVLWLVWILKFGINKKQQLYYCRAGFFCKAGSFRIRPPVLQTECKIFILLAISFKCHDPNFGWTLMF